MRALFGGHDATPLPEDVSALLDAAVSTPFTVDEVAAALGKMGGGKSTGIAQFAIDAFKGAGAPMLQAIADLFATFHTHGYPSRLNTLLILPLFKGKGNAADCDNYRPISLIHPLGRLYAKCVEARLAGDPHATRAWG